MPVGKALAVVVEEEADIAAFKDYKPTDGAPDAAPTSEKPAPAAPAPAAQRQPTPAAKPAAAATQARPGSRVFASPLARRTAADASVSLQSVVGTGPGGRVVAADVADALAAGPVPATAAAPVWSAQYSDIDATKFQRVAAERLTMSKQTVPHYYLTTECTVDTMLALRAKLNAKAGDKGPRLSVNDFVIKAAAASLKRVPEVNAQWMGDTIRMFHAADISVAVQTPNGLITPIIKDADRKGIRAISEEVKELAARAKENKLAPEEFMGGTFTISNLGMFGVTEFSAIVNPPQAAILAVGTSVKQVAPDADADSGFGTKTVMKVTLSCDHRVVDGAVGAQWLQAFRACLEDPVEMIL